MAFAYKRGKFWHVRYKRPDGTWGGASKDAEGNRFTTERSAEEYGQSLEVAARAKKFVDPQSGKITLGSWADLWIESIEVGPLSERDYRSRLKAAIRPKWGTTPVADITTIMYHLWVKEMRAEGRSENSIRGITSVFRTMLDDAVTSKVIGENPVPPKKAARRGKFKGKPKQDDTVIATPRQALLVARNALDLRGLNLYVMILTIAYTGLRIGEIAGLHREWCTLGDADGRGARIKLEKQSQYIDGKPELVDPKYDSGRDLIIPPFLAELLGQLLDSHKSKFVFTAPKGGRLLIGGDFYAYNWQPAVNGRAPVPSSRGHKAQPGIRPVAGVGGMTPHGLRHSHKVWLDEQNVPRVAVEERLGHELPGVEGTYSHTTLAMELKIASVLQELWEQSQAEGGPEEYGPVPEPEPEGLADGPIKIITQKSRKRPAAVSLT